MSVRDSSDDELRDESADKDLPAISDAPHRSFGVTATPRDRPLFRQSSTLRYEGLPEDTRAAAARLASDRSVTPAVRKDRRSELLPAVKSEPHSGEDPALVIEALNPHLAWLAEDRRPTLNAHVLRGDLDAALAMLREELRRYPKNISIARSVQVVERALIARLNNKLEPHDRVLSIVRPLVKARETADTKKILDMVDGASTLEDVIRRSPLKRLETLVTISELLTRGVLAVPSPLTVRARRDPRVEDSNPGRMQQPAPNPVRIARLAKQLGMDLREEEAAEDELRARAGAIDCEIDRDDGDRATLSDPIETEVRAALTRSEMRTKPPPAGPPLSREEPDAPSEIRVESIRPSRTVTIEPPPHDEGPSGRASDGEAPITVRGAATVELLDAAGGRKRGAEASSAPAITVEASDTNAAPAEETDKPPSVRPSKHGPKAPALDDDAPPALPAYAKPVAIAAAACALVGAVAFAMSGGSPPEAPPPASSHPQLTAAVTAVTGATTAAPPTAATTAAAAASSAVAATTIKLRVEVSPDYARVTLDGKKLKAPFKGSLPKDGAKHVLKIDAPGHKQKKIEIVASADTNLVIALEPLPKVTKPTAEPVDPPPAPPPDPPPSPYD